MSHIRAQVRDAVKTILETGSVLAARVHGSRVQPIPDNTLPCWRVFVSGETCEPVEVGAPRALRRTIRLVLEGFAEITGNEDALDALSLEAEILLAADPALGGLAHDHHLVSADFTLDGEGRTALGLVSLAYDVTVMTLDTDPQTPT